MKAQNYSAELTAKIVSDYQSGVDVTDIASAIDKAILVFVVADSIKRSQKELGMILPKHWPDRTIF